MGGIVMELIKSNFTRMRYNELGVEFTDFNKATITWNKRILTHKEKLDELMMLHNSTADTKLKAQIKERIDWENRILETFKIGGENIVYLVTEAVESCIYGLFTKYETALLQAKKIAKEDDVNMKIEKYIVATEDYIPLQKYVARITSKEPHVMVYKDDYFGWPEAAISINSKGEIIHIWSNEIVENDEMLNSKERFEYKFISVPYVHYKGIPVKNVINNEWGILTTDKKEWDDCLQKIEEGLWVDYTDIAHTVYCLTEKGYWSHEHWSPFDMEMGFPKAETGDAKEQAFLQAMDVMSEYLSGYRDEAHEKIVLEKSKEYAKVCAGIHNFPDKAEDLFC